MDYWAGNDLNTQQLIGVGKVDVEVKGISPFYLYSSLYFRNFSCRL